MLTLRLREGTLAYEVLLVSRHREIYADSIRYSRHFEGYDLYYWHPVTTYKTLDWEIIRESMDLANFVVQIHQAMLAQKAVEKQQAYNIAGN